MIKSTPAKITNEISDGLLTPSPDIHDGEILEQRGKLDEALVVYRRCIEACKATFATFANGRSNNRAIDDRNAAIDNIAHLAFTFLTRGEFKKGFDAANDALPLMPSSAMLDIRRAHALMFLGKEEEARRVYLHWHCQAIGPGQRGEHVILQDLKALHQSDRVNPLIDEIETLFSVPPQAIPHLVLIR